MSGTRTLTWLMLTAWNPVFTGAAGAPAAVDAPSAKAANDTTNSRRDNLPRSISFSMLSIVSILSAFHIPRNRLSKEFRFAAYLSGEPLAVDSLSAATRTRFPIFGRYGECH